MDQQHSTPRAPHTPRVPVPPVPNRAETEMRAPGAGELEYPRPAELDLPGRARPELQVGTFKPLELSGNRAATPLGNFDAEANIPENGMEN